LGTVVVVNSGDAAAAVRGGAVMVVSCDGLGTWRRNSDRDELVG
jgi:hypothetical protein